MTIILRKCIRTRILRVQLHVGLVGMTSLIYPTFATTGLEIQQFSTWIPINFLLILASKIDLKSMLILSSVFDHFFDRFSLLFGSRWVPLGAILPPLRWYTDPGNAIF